MKALPAVRVAGAQAGSRFVVGAAVFLIAPLTAPGGERELWALWQMHLRTQENHPRVVEACRSYIQALPEDPFVPVVEGLETWHLLRAGQTDDATRLLAPHQDTEGTALERGAQRLARAWTTRLLRNQVVDSLQVYYRDEVRYPPDLASLVNHPAGAGQAQPPLHDAWGKAWRYRLTGFRDVPGFRDQKYRLESVSIQAPFDVSSALAMPYAEQLRVQPTRVPQSVQGVPLVRLEMVGPEGQSDAAVAQVGERVDGFYIAYAGPQLVILCDTLHWKVLTWNP